MSSLPNSEPPPSGEQPPPALGALGETFKYEHVVDGFLVPQLGNIITTYLEQRQPVGLMIERDQARRFAESVRKVIEGNPKYHKDVAITAQHVHSAIEELILSWARRPAPATSEEGSRLN